MATRWAVATGNWSNTATWNGGTLPAAGDDVHANNFTVTIDQNITANALRIDAGGSAVQGGGFVCAGSYTIALQALAVGLHTGSSTSILSLTGGSATVSVAGAITGDQSSSGGEPPALTVSGGTHTLSAGSITGGAVSGAWTVSVTGGALAISVGTITGAFAMGVSVTGGSASITATNIYGGSATTGPGIEVGAAGVATIRGTLRPGSLSSGGIGSPAVSSAGVVRYSGHIYSGGMAVSTGPNGYLPIAGTWSVIDGEEVSLHVYNDDNYPSGNNGTETILTQYGTDLPDQGDVRDGVLYGPSSTLEGTLAVPPAASVAAGVPVDDTVGTATLDRDDLIADILAGVGAQIEGSH